MAGMVDGNRRRRGSTGASVATPHLAWTPNGHVAVPGLGQYRRDA